MIIARWINEDRTRGAMLDSDGTLSIIERENSGQLWSPPTKLRLEAKTKAVASALKSDEGYLDG